MNLVPHSIQPVLLLGLPAYGNQCRGVKHPLVDVGGEGPVAWCAAVGKLAHLRMRGLDTVVRHTGELRARRIGIHNNNPWPKVSAES